MIHWDAFSLPEGPLYRWTSTDKAFTAAVGPQKSRWGWTVYAYQKGIHTGGECDTVEDAQQAAEKALRYFDAITDTEQRDTVERTL